MTMLGFQRGQMRQNVLMALWDYDHQLGDTGIVIFGVGHLVKPGTLLEADVSYTSRTRVPLVPTLYMPAAPELAVDIVRVCTVPAHMPSKARLLLAGGTRRFWVVDPESERVVEYAPTGITIFTKDDTLAADDILPGFTLAIREIFAL